MRAFGETRMDFEEFDREYSILLNFFNKQGFHRNPDVQERGIYSRLLGYRLDVGIITSRLEKEISDFDVLKRNIFQILQNKEKLHEKSTEEFVWTMHRILLDVSDFYIYTRIFLDAIASSIRQSFKSAGNENWKIMENSITMLTNKKKLQTCKEGISSDFFEGLEKKVHWIHDFKKTRNFLIHEYSLPKIATTKNGKLGYAIDVAKEIDWDTYTYTPIFKDLQKVINNLSDLMKYLSTNLPRAT